MNDIDFYEIFIEMTENLKIKIKNAENFLHFNNMG